MRKYSRRGTRRSRSRSNGREREEDEEDVGCSDRRWEHLHKLTDEERRHLRPLSGRFPNNLCGNGWGGGGGERWANSRPLSGGYIASEMNGGITHIRAMITTPIPTDVIYMTNTTRRHTICPVT